MAEQDQSAEKTEEGSEKKLREAIEQGNIPFSREASVFLSLGAMLVITSLTLTNSIRSLSDTLSQLFANPTRSLFATPADALNVFRFATDASAAFLTPILLTLMVSGLVAGLAQGMPRIAFDRIKPKWSKISPAGGLKRLVGRDGQIESLKSLAKFAIVTVVVALILRNDAQGVMATLFVEPTALGPLMLGMVGRLIAGSLVAYAVLAGGDLVWSRIKWRRDLRMTRQEVKDEHKEAEGDPLFKAKRRSLALDRSRRRMMADVRKATLVIANPTHYAIALRYVREEGTAPKVVAKGQDLIALKIREIAEQHAIPVVEDKALARSMYDHVEVSQMIPPEFYKAVAGLIHFLQTRNSRQTHGGLKA